MNIPHLVFAVESLDLAIEATFDPNDRANLKQINRRLRRILRKHGVFLGQQDTTRKVG